MHSLRGTIGFSVALALSRREKGCPPKAPTASSPPTMSVPSSTNERAHTAPYWEVVRARIVLLAAEGLANKEIAARLDTTPQTVCKWRKRFYEEGLGGLEDRPRSGRPPTFSPRDEDRAEGIGLRTSG